MTLLTREVEDALHSDAIRMAVAYRHRIRNPRKKAYADSYTRHLLGGYDEPDRMAFGVSAMGAQAVRMSLREILYWTRGGF